MTRAKYALRLRRNWQIAVILIRLRALRLPREIDQPSGAGITPIRARSSPDPASGPSPAMILLLPKRRPLLIPYFQGLPFFRDSGREKQGPAVPGNLGTGHFQGVPLF